MSDLTLVRHGQASFDKAHYDELSAVGHRQSTLLGEWMAARGMEFDAVVYGSMARHRDTLAAIVHAYGARRLQLPTAQVVETLDEYEHRSILEAFARREPAHPAVQASEGGRSRDPRRLFDFLRAALGSWASGALDGDVIEPWADFRARIGRAASSCARAPARAGGEFRRRDLAARAARARLPRQPRGGAQPQPAQQRDVRVARARRPLPPVELERPAAPVLADAARPVDVLLTRPARRPAARRAARGDRR